MRRQVFDISSPRVAKLHQPLALQREQRLPHWHATDAKPLRNGRLSEEVTGRDLAIEDFLPEAGDGDVGAGGCRWR
jgi:hypothetical protein